MYNNYGNSQDIVGGFGDRKKDCKFNPLYSKSITCKSGYRIKVNQTNNKDYRRAMYGFC